MKIAKTQTTYLLGLIEVELFNSKDLKIFFHPILKELYLNDDNLLPCINRHFQEGYVKNNNIIKDLHFHVLTYL